MLLKADMFRVHVHVCVYMYVYIHISNFGVIWHVFYLFNLLLCYVLNVLQNMICLFNVIRPTSIFLLFFTLDFCN